MTINVEKLMQDGSRQAVVGQIAKEVDSMRGFCMDLLDIIERPEVFTKTGNRLNECMENIKTLKACPINLIMPIILLSC